MKVNFSKFETFTSIRKDSVLVMDIKESLADTLYQRCAGIKAAALAMKIYNSSDEIELNDDEITIIDNVMIQSTGLMNDSWNRLKMQKT